jgi:hypothetical protein
MDYKIKGYVYPFQEAKYWVGRGGLLASYSNTNGQSRRIVREVYDMGATLVLVPGGEEDDYAEQLYVMVLPEDIEVAKVDLATKFHSAGTFVETLEVTNDGGTFTATFLIVDWSYSGTHCSNSSRYYRRRNSG